VAILCTALLLLVSCDVANKRPDADATDQPDSNAVCLAAQRSVFPALVEGWRTLAAAMTVVDPVASSVILQPWLHALDESRAAVAKEGCPDPPGELAPFVALTAELNRASHEVTQAEAHNLGVLLRELGDTLQVSSLDFDERLLNLPITCAEIGQQVSATYSIRSVATPTGRDVWAVLSVQNSSSLGVYAAVDGGLVATDPVNNPAAVSWRPTVLGGYAGPFRTSQHPLLGVGGERLHLSASGRVAGPALTVQVGASAGRRNCAITARRTLGDITVAAAGDIACGPASPGYNSGRGVPGRCHQKATASLVGAMKPDAVFVLGDLQYQVGTPANFQAGYGRSWGRFKDITYPVPGDHEYGDPGAAGYFGYFGTRATPQDPDCEASCRGYYSFDLGAWHVVALNANCGKLPAGDGCSRGSAQNQWLDQDLKLANRMSACTVVLMHEPRWSSSHKQSAELAPLVSTMHANGVELVLSGSSHAYERFAPQTPAGKLDKTSGITQMVVGTGGAHFTGFTRPAENSLVRKSKVFGILQLTLQDAGYRWAFRPDPSTPFKDSGSRACH
jgi:hypothetical protein